ncbi:hypothetical protein BGX28_010116 [Mortierella sp. GBA30]|nr:hypothetical protein BGX28_010116 [Mortierella sp. GBA30]
MCFDTATYDLLRDQQEQLLKKKQQHQHQIWQHVQDRLAEHNKVLEQEKAQEKHMPVQGTKATKKQKSSRSLKEDEISSSASSSTVTSASGSPETASPTKRSIRWGLQNNTTKRFDKTIPITLVPVPAVDKRPTKSALKVRTPHTIRSSHTSSIATATAATKHKSDTNTQSSTIPIRKHAVDFF